eukprot:TRINITY_DN9671_c0_g1_i1.p1 TRINITY_DN9671_c0_g1~~TRINITY_DN9671_c0_g1_i1.p1  ORF type:complete len:192 (-),score=58.35 TRINITY_DN9671_c0_g1_i1:450-1025(-)
MHSPSLRQAKAALLKARGIGSSSSCGSSSRGSGGTISATGADGAGGNDVERYLQRFAEVFFAPTAWSSRFGEKFFTAAVMGAEIVKDGPKVAVYRIVCRCGTQEWSVKRRYSEFATLFETVISALHIPPSEAPALPPKTPLWQDKNAPQVVQERRVGLNGALVALLSLPGVVQHTATRAFLAIPGSGNSGC